jgi:DNA-binding winged helix-turn-helix (wHTH) protein/tetratricopeptide (TPR) repeat protein/TolB-like protein
MMIARPEEKERVLYEFDAFRVDPVRRILLRDGVPVAITPKAFSILLALLERAGEVVEKSDLIERVWPGVFVTEANLTQNVFSLRKCLGEKANENRYIVTVPGQGYQFAGDLRRIERSSTTEMPIVEPEPPPVPATDLTPTPPSFPSLVLAREAPAAAPLDGTAAVPAPARTPGRLRRVLAWSGAGVVALLVILTVVHILQHLGPAARRPAGSPAGTPLRQAIAVLDFKSLSPSAETRWLESAFAEMLTTELAAGGKMRVIRGDTVAQTTRSLALRDPGSLGPPELQKLHDALGADLVVVGSFLPIQGNIRVDLRVMQVPSGDTQTSLVEVGTQSGLFDLVSRMGEKLRDSLGVAALSAQQVREAAALRPSNPDSSRLYAEGLTALHAFDPPGGLRLLQRAAAVDARSAVIHSGLSQAWSALGYDSRAVDEAHQALNLAASLSREDRLAIEGRLFKASKQWDKASETYRSLWTFYPDDVEYGLQLGDSLISGGRNAEAGATFTALRKLPPPAGLDPRIDIAEARSASRLSDLATELRASRAAEEKGRRSGQSLVVAQALIYEGDSLLRMGQPQDAVRMFRESAELTKKAGYSWGYGQALANVAGGLEALGDLDGAEKANLEALAIAQKIGSGIGIASQYLSLGSLHKDRGELSEALRSFEQSNEWYVRIGDRLMETRTLNALSSVLASQGDLAGARQRCERSLALSQALGDPADEAIARDNLGTVLEAQGDLSGARRRHEEAFFLLRKRGDASSAAAALAASASAAARLGDLHTAWQRSAEALATQQQAGDRVGAGRILGLRARLAYQMGDLAASRLIAQEQLQISRQTGARSIVALALQSLGRADLAAGDPAAARGELEEALRVSSGLGEELRAMEIRLDLAELALAAGQAGEAVALARQAAEWSKGHGVPDGEARALSTLAESLLLQGERKEALAAADAARARLDTTEDRELRVTVGIRLGRIAAATGNAAAALRQLRRAVDDAAGFGLATAGLEARLALGEAQRGAGDPAAVATLAAVRQEAATRGFKRLAQAAGKG